MNRLVIIVLWILAGTFHQLMYLVLPLFSLPALKRAVISKVALSYLALAVSFLIIEIGFIFFNGSLTLYHLNGIARVFCYFFFALIVSRLSTTTLDVILESLLKLLSILSIVGAVYIIFDIPFRFIFPHQNHFAYVLVVLIYFCLAYWKFLKYPGYYLISLIILIISTKSTGGLVIAGLVLILEILFSRRYSFIKKSLFLLLLVLMGIVLINWTPDKIVTQIEGISSLSWDSILIRAEDHIYGGFGSGIWRITYGLSIILEFLKEDLSFKIFGMGIDSLTRGNFIYDFIYIDPHNDYVKILVEMGFLGLLLFIIFLISLWQLQRFKISFLVVLTLPILFGNIVVNFPYNITLILSLTLLSRIQEK